MIKSELKKRLKGTIVPMPTPFKENLEIDYEGLRMYTRFLIDNGIKVISPLGSTGQFDALTMEERKKVMKTVVEEANHEAVVVVGAGHSGTSISNELVHYAEEIGADAVLVCPPYYQYSGAEGIYQHYKTLSDNNSIGIVVYNNKAVIQSAPLDLSLYDKVTALDNVVGVKEASGDYNFYYNLQTKFGDRVAIIGGGSMRHYLWGYMWGSPAYFASLANFVPQVEVEFFELLTQGKINKAKEIVVNLEQPFFEVAVKFGWQESLKATMEVFGLPAGPPRLPLIPLSEEKKEELRKVLTSLGLLKNKGIF